MGRYSIAMAMVSYETAINTGETIGLYVAGVLATLMRITSSLMSVFAVLMIVFTFSGRIHPAAGGVGQGTR